MKIQLNTGEVITDVRAINTPTTKEYALVFFKNDTFRRISKDSIVLIQA